MGIEIERKFLVTGEFRSGEPVHFLQGYLSREPGRTVRARIADDQAWLTIKSLTNNTVRQEFEYEIPLADAKQMIELCDGPVIEKHRWNINYLDHLWEVDVFSGDNQGLIVAEIELTAPDEHFVLPPWVGEEVSHDPRYHNSQLSVHPYKNW